MKADDIRDWDDVEIQARIGELKDERFKLKFQSSMMELENANLIKTIRRDIARMHTILRERERAGNEQEEE